MKSERKIIEQIVELAEEIGRREVYIKFEKEKTTDDKPESIKQHNKKIEDMHNALSTTRYALNTILNIFEQ